MSKSNTPSILAFYVLLTMCCGSSSYLGTRAANELHPREVVVEVEVVEAETTEPAALPAGDLAAEHPSRPTGPTGLTSPTKAAAISQPAPAEPAKCAEPAASQLVQCSLPLQAEVPPAPPKAATAPQAAPPSHPRQAPPVHDALNISVPGAATLNQAAPGTDPWEFRKNLGLGLRGSSTWSDSSPEYSATAYGYWEFLRIADTYFTSYGEINDDRNKKVQLDMQWRNR
uniref:Uncharacterized protein n=1 Tax=Geobacter sp. (strain M21) TaxID=443144 RepID=C6E6R9_GEOSM